MSDTLHWFRLCIQPYNLFCTYLAAPDSVCFLRNLPGTQKYQNLCPTPWHPTEKKGNLTLKWVTSKFPKSLKLKIDCTCCWGISNWLHNRMCTVRAIFSSDSKSFLQIELCHLNHFLSHEFWWSDELFSSLNFGEVTDRQVDRQKAMHMMHRCAKQTKLKLAPTDIYLKQNEARGLKVPPTNSQQTHAVEKLVGADF